MPQDRHESVQEIAKRLEGAQACVRHRHRQVLAYGRLWFRALRQGTRNSATREERDGSQQQSR